MQGYEGGYENLEQVFRRMVLVIRRRGTKIMGSIFIQFPKGKRKALTLSYDDGVEQDILSLIHISEPTRHSLISYAVFCLKKIFFF